MANNKSAKKRIQIAERNRLENKSYKSSVRTLIKKCFAVFGVYQDQPSEDSKKEIEKTVNEAFSKIDKAVKKGVLHQNNGANQKSRLAAAAKNAFEAGEKK